MFKILLSFFLCLFFQFSAFSSDDNNTSWNSQYVDSTESGVLLKAFAVYAENNNSQTNYFNFTVGNIEIPYVMRLDLRAALFSDEGKVSASLNGQEILINEFGGDEKDNEHHHIIDLSLHLQSNNQLKVTTKGLKSGVINIKLYCLLTKPIFTHSFTKGKNKLSETVNFPASNNNYIIRLQNGLVKKEMATSARIILNNKTIFSQDNFDKKTFILNREILFQASNTLTVIDAGKPGNVFEIEVIPLSLTPPTITITSPQNNIYTNLHNIRIEGSFSSIQETTILVNNLPAVISGNTFYFDADLTEGINTFEIKASDCCTLNTSSALTINADYTPPIINIAGNINSGDFTNKQKITFNLSADEPVSYFCNLDSLEFTPCTDYIEYNNLLEGFHNFQAKAIDRAGNVSTIIPAISFTTDYTAPVITSFIPSNGTFTKNNQAFFTAFFTENNQLSEDSAIFKIDGITYPSFVDWVNRNVINPVPGATILSDGIHEFSLKMTDRAGNVSDILYSTVTIDTVPPQITITSNITPGQLNNKKKVTFSLTSNEPVIFFCNLDTNPQLPCPSYIEYENLSEGQHQFQVKATDMAGNNSSKGMSFRLDYTKPVITSFIPQSGSFTKNNHPFFTATFTENNFLNTNRGVFKIDGTIYPSFVNYGNKTINNPQSNATTLPEGLHEFSLKITDEAGNESDTVYSTVTIDITPPSINITSNVTPGQFSNKQKITFDLTSNEIVNFFCNLDTNPQVPCASYIEFENLSEGSHQFQSKATDRAGNSSSKGMGFKLDYTKPVVLSLNGKGNNETLFYRYTPKFINISYTENNPVLADYGTLTLDNSQILLNIDDNNKLFFTEMPENLSEGTHTFNFTLYDIAGNISDPFVSQIIFDRTPPKIVSINPQDGFLTNIKEQELLITVEEASSVKVFVDGTEAIAITPRSFTYPVTLDEGLNKFKIVAEDSGGLKTYEKITYILDTTPPFIELVSPDEKSLNANPVAFYFNCSEENCNKQLFVNEEQVSAGSQICLPFYENLITFYATDVAGNVCYFTNILTQKNILKNKRD